MEKESFILYLEQQEVFEMLTDEEAGKLIKAIFEYEKTRKISEVERPIQIAFMPIKIVLDKNREKYNKKVEANKKNIEKRWNKENTKNTIGKNGINTNTQNTDNDNEYDNVNVNVNDNVNNNIPASEVKTSTASVKASKHKYGEFKNVLLKDEELQSLKEQYQNWEELIEYLDQYIEMKGYKAKSHYLCIKNWVIDAVKKKKINNNKTQNKTAMEEFLNG